MKGHFELVPVFGRVPIFLLEKRLTWLNVSLSDWPLKRYDAVHYEVPGGERRLPLAPCRSRFSR